MGVYLSSPITEKESINEKCDGFVYGASSMQGWRTTQEDAHNCIPVFDEKTKTSFFAVYDGHGGSEVAKYCELHFPDFVKEMMDRFDGSKEPSQFIKNAFLAFDATLTNEDVIRELKELAGKDDEADEDEDEDPVGRTEADRLKEEATMPLDELLAQYKPGQEDEDKKAFQSPAVVAKGSLKINAGEGSSQSTENGEEDEQPSSSSTATVPQQSLPSSSTPVDPEAAASSSSSSSSTEKAASSSSSLLNGKTKDSNSNNATGEPSGAAVSGSSNKNNNNNDNNKASNGSQSKGDKSGVGGSSSGGSTSATKSAEAGAGSGNRASKERALAGMANTAESSDDDDDDDDDEEEEEVWGASDDEEEDEEEDDEEEEDIPTMDMTNEDPGSDSGCTACVVLIQDKKVIVANAGDSRCVLARAGKAVELSFDHKPEDDPERSRIEKAGGKVTADGRVNGGLNLSRAIGDHVYKRNHDLPAKDQMITALPDIETAELGDDDQFLIIACDGIWNYMSSQEVVDYVLVKLKDPEKRNNPSLVCEELFDHCLAPNTFGDGTGCDNMTSILIVLDSFKPTESDSEGIVTSSCGEKDQHLDSILKDFHTSAEEAESSSDVPDFRDSSADLKTKNVSLKRPSEDGEESGEKRLKVSKDLV